MKKLIKLYIITLISIIIVHFNNIISEPNISGNKYDIFKNYFLGCTSFIEARLFTYVLSLSIMLIFTLYFFNYIYKDICLGGIYIFTRQKSRKKWYVKKISFLFGMSSAFSLLSCLTDYLLAYRNCDYFFNRDILIFFISLFIAEISIVYSFCVLQNILSVFCGTINAFLVVMLIFLSESYLSKIIIEQEKNIFPLCLINPLLSFSGIINSQTCITEVIISAAVIVAVISLAGYIIIQRKDIGMNNKDV